MTRWSQTQGWARRCRLKRTPWVQCVLEQPHPSPCPASQGQRLPMSRQTAEGSSLQKWEKTSGKREVFGVHAGTPHSGMGGQLGSQLPPLHLKQGLPMHTALSSRQNPIQITGHQPDEPPSPEWTNKAFTCASRAQSFKVKD